MTLDTSAVLAILEGEPEAAAFERLAAMSEQCQISSVSYLEASIVLFHRRGSQAISALDLLLEALEADIVPFTSHQARVARHAYAAYGKGLHRAGLNFGDCAAYALAVDSDDSLLFKGQDFNKTDVRPAFR